MKIRIFVRKGVFLFQAVILLFLLSGNIFSDIPPSERAALIALYNSTNGDGWYDNQRWKSNRP